MQRDHLFWDRQNQRIQRVAAQINHADAQHTEARQAGQHALHELPRAVPQVESPQARALAQELDHGAEQRAVIAVPDQRAAERLEARQHGVRASDDVVAREHDARRGGLLERAVQRERAQRGRVRDAREHERRDARVDEVEVRQAPDGGGLEGEVPRVRALQVRAERQAPQRARVPVEHRAHLAHVCEAVVVFGPQAEGAEVAEGGLRAGDVSTNALC